ncbi:MAG: DsbA family protein [Candidatus Omnitrophica bacterium]|nr:DsbA family protein [Candidatus Omnitrophota bacterium]
MNKRYLVMGGIIVAFAIATIFLLKKNPKPPVFPAPVENPKAKGPVDAPIEIIEFSDFQCPACGFAIPIIQQVMDQFPGSIRFIYYHYPLPGHRSAPLAHQAAECAARQNKFWPMHDMLYKEQRQWSKVENPSKLILTYGREIGLDGKRFIQCLTDEETAQTITDEQQQGEVLLVRSTPTFFINRQRFVGAGELLDKGAAFIRQELGLDPLPVLPVEPQTQKTPASTTDH